MGWQTANSFLAGVLGGIVAGAVAPRRSEEALTEESRATFNVPQVLFGGVQKPRVFARSPMLVCTVPRVFPGAPFFSAARRQSACWSSSCTPRMLELSQFLTRQRR